MEKENNQNLKDFKKNLRKKIIKWIWIITLIMFITAVLLWIKNESELNIFGVIYYIWIIWSLILIIFLWYNIISYFKKNEIEKNNKIKLVLTAIFWPILIILLVFGSGLINFLFSQLPDLIEKF